MLSILYPLASAYIIKAAEREAWQHCRGRIWAEDLIPGLARHPSEGGPQVLGLLFRAEGVF